MSDNIKKDKVAKNDNDLNDLLDDALKDFEKSDQTAQQSNADNTIDDTDDQNAFFIEQAKLFSERMNAMYAQQGDAGEDLLTDQVMAGFKKMAEATAIALQGDSTANDDEVKKYSDSISEALKGMNEASDTLQSGISEADVAKLFSGLGLEEAESEENPFVPFMEGMIQSLLSPEILLPGIKDLLEKYPKFFEEHGDKLSPEDKERFEKQLDLYKVICNRLESEKPDATPKEKRESYGLVMEDMRKLQEYGQPPEEIVGELTDIPGVDGAAAPAAAANPQCPMM